MRRPRVRPEGVVTRGTTGIGRLRRIDRGLAADPRVVSALTGADVPVVVDLGYGARPDTAIEFAARMRVLRPDLDAYGLEIDPARVVPDQGGVRFRLGGFELAGLRPNLLRAYNVLRQYDEAEVADVWRGLTSRLAPGGVLIEGTCDELGRRCAWVLADASGPQSLTLAWAPGHSARPSDVAERLPKALIHHNRPGTPIHAVLAELDRAWDVAAPFATFGPRARWRAALDVLATRGSIPQAPSLDDRLATAARRRLRERRGIDNRVTLPWELVAPAAGSGTTAKPAGQRP